MSTRVGVGIAAMFIAILLALGSALAAEIHLQIDPQKSQIKTTVADPLAKLRETGEIEATLRIISGNVDGDPQNPGETGHIKLVIDATSFDSGNNHRDKVVLGTALDTAEYQTISFESTHLENVQIDVPARWAMWSSWATSRCTGRLARFACPPMFRWIPTACGDGEVSFNYTDFGVRVPRLLFALAAGTDVTVHFHVTAARPNSARVNQAARPSRS